MNKEKKNSDRNTVTKEVLNKCHISDRSVSIVKRINIFIDILFLLTYPGVISRR